MCYITATELKNNLGHYMELSQKEDVCVTKNGKVITVLTNEASVKLIALEKARGCLGKVKKDIDYDAIIKEEISRRCGY